MSPQYRMDTMAQLQEPAHHRKQSRSAPPARRHQPLRRGPTPRPRRQQRPRPRPELPPVEQVLGNLASIVPGAEQGTISHYNVQPVIDIYTNVEGTDLGSVTRAMEQIVARHKKELPRGSHFILRGQSETMHSSYIGLLSGLAFSILLVYLLIVVNFQSWLDPFLIISALPAALAGIVWFLFLTNTRLSVPALTGAIMCMGVATANSILVVSFAREQMEAWSATRGRRAECRLRPPAPGAHDRAGHDHRHGAHGAGPGRRRRAECAARPRGHRRPAAGHRGHALLCACILLLYSRPLERRRRVRMCARRPQDFDEFDETPE